MTDLLQALADSTRRQILTSLQARREAVTVDEVAAAQGIHRTVAFEHLELLARLGLLVRDSRAGFRGRRPGPTASLARLPRSATRRASIVCSRVF